MEGKSINLTIPKNLRKWYSKISPERASLKEITFPPIIECVYFFISSYDAHIRNNLPEVFVQESVEHWVCNSRGHAYQVADAHTYREGFFILKLEEIRKVLNKYSLNPEVKPID